MIWFQTKTYVPINEFKNLNALLQIRLAREKVGGVGGRRVRSKMQIQMEDVLRYSNNCVFAVHY